MATLLFWVALSHRACAHNVIPSPPPSPPASTPVPHRAKIKVEELAQLNKFPSKWNANMPSSYYYNNDLPPWASEFIMRTTQSKCKAASQGWFKAASFSQLWWLYHIWPFCHFAELKTKLFSLVDNCPVVTRGRKTTQLTLKVTSKTQMQCLK